MTASEFGVVSLRELLHRAIRCGLAPGLVAGWQSNDGTGPHIASAGRATVTPGSTEVSEETRFDLASLTKPLVVGTLSLLAMRDGCLTPETRVADVLPETFSHTTGALSVRQLLTHSSGLPAWEPIYVLAGGDPNRLLDALGAMEIDRPGDHVVYACPGFILLGAMLSRLAGVDLHQQFLDRVTGPLGIEDELGYRPALSRPLAGGARAPATEELLLEERGLDSRLIPPTAPGQPDDGNSRFLDGVAGNAGLFGTVAGVLALAKVYLTEGGFLNSEEIALATTDHTPGLEQARGFGWQLASSPGCSAGPALTPSSFGHTGFTGTSLWIDPTRGIAMALLANRIHPGHRPTDLHPLRRRFHQLVIDQHV